MVRRITNDVISAVEDGFVSWEEVARACLSYMSEDEVAELADFEDWAIADDDELDYEEDDDNDVVYYCFDFNDDIIDEFTDQEDAIDFAESDLGITKVVRYVGDNPDGEVWRREDDDTVVYYCLDFNGDIIDEFADEDDAIDFAESDLGIEKVVRYIGDTLDEEVWKRDDEDVLAEAVNTPESEDELVGDDYRKLDFLKEGLLVGDIELSVEDVEVLDQFDNDIYIDYTYTARVTPETVIEFICSQNDVKKEDLTVSQAQKFIDRLVRNLTPYYDMLIEFYYDEIQNEAQQYIMEN